MTEKESQGPSVRQSAQRLATTLLTPPRTAMVLGLGGLVLIARAVRWTVDQAAEEGEHQLSRVNELWHRRESTQRDTEAGRSSA